MREKLLLLSCVLCYGTATFFKRLGLLSLNPFQFLFVVGVIYFVFTPLWWRNIAASDQSAFSTVGIVYAVSYALCSILGGLSLAFLLREVSSPSSVIVMVNLSSFIAIGLSYWLLNEPFNPMKTVAILLAIVSCILINF